MAKQWKRSLSGADVQAEAEDALEKDISQLSPNSNSVAGNLDGGLATVDWSSKTAEIGFGESSNADTDLVSVSGSGYIIGVNGQADGSEQDDIRMDIDGTTLIDQNVKDFGGWRSESGGKAAISWSGLHRFDSSFAVGTGGFVSDKMYIGVSYVID